MAATNVTQVATYLTDDEREKVKRAAWLEDVTVARWIRAAVREKLKREAANGQG